MKKEKDWHRLNQEAAEKLVAIRIAVQQGNRPQAVTLAAERYQLLQKLACLH